MYYEVQMTYDETGDMTTDEQNIQNTDYNTVGINLWPEVWNYMHTICTRLSRYTIQYQYNNNKCQLFLHLMIVTISFN